MAARKYNRKQIVGAIRFWKKQLGESICRAEESEEDQRREKEEEEKKKKAAIS